MKTITRAKYLDRIIELNGTPDIKIITGIRRSGKSKLMQAYIAYLKSNFENINIIFIDFMDLAYEEIKEYHALHAYVEEHYQEGKTNYLFDKGLDKILKKMGEEASEIIIAAKNPDPEDIKYEISDFMYHMMVLMAEKGVTWEEITQELSQR